MQIRLLYNFNTAFIDMFLMSPMDDFITTKLYNRRQTSTVEEINNLWSKTGFHRTPLTKLVYKINTWNFI